MYENAQYMVDLATNKVTSIRVDINGVTSFVPIDPENTDYQTMMQLVDEGKLVIAPAD
jgi:hypothetical protein